MYEEGREGLYAIVREWPLTGSRKILGFQYFKKTLPFKDIIRKAYDRLSSRQYIYKLETEPFSSIDWCASTMTIENLRVPENKEE